MAREYFNIQSIVITVALLYAFYRINVKFSQLDEEIDQLRKLAATTQLPTAMSTTPKQHEITVNEEKWENFLLIGKVPAAVRHLYVYSQQESARLERLKADDPEVIEYIRKYKLVPIPPLTRRTTLPAKDTSKGNAPQLMNIFRNKTDGFFVECGAFDGYGLSNTFFVERQFNWTGLLIEAEPNNFEQLVEMKRNAYLAPLCLSKNDQPQLMKFTFGKQMAARIACKFKNDTVTVQCVPLYSLLLAVNQTTVDLFSLDIEGAELDILLTVPFDKVDIKVLVIEFFYTHQGRKALDDFMASKGYVEYPSKKSERRYVMWAHHDVIFVKKDSGYRYTRDDLDK